MDWEVTGASRVSLHVTVPFDCEAKLSLPWAKDQDGRILEAGEYSFLLESREPLIGVPSTKELLGD